MVPYPQIDLDRCTGCRLCVEACPVQALEQIADKAALTRPQHCTYCSLCEDICPKDAIALPFLIRLGSHQIENEEEKASQKGEPNETQS